MGVVVTGVQPGSVAQTAGLLRGDLLIAIGGSTIENLADFRTALKNIDDDRRLPKQADRGDPLLSDQRPRLVAPKVRPHSAPLAYG